MDSIQELGVRVSVRDQPEARAVTWIRETTECDLEWIRDSGATSIEELPDHVIAQQVWFNSIPFEFLEKIQTLLLFKTHVLVLLLPHHHHFGYFAILGCDRQTTVEGRRSGYGRSDRRTRFYDNDKWGWCC